MHANARTARPQRLTLLILAGTLFLNACASTVPSGTKAACDALLPYLPTVSVQDTEETLQSVLKYYDVFESVCK